MIVTEVMVQLERQRELKPARAAKMLEDLPQYSPNLQHHLCLRGRRGHPLDQFGAHPRLEIVEWTMQQTAQASVVRLRYASSRPHHQHQRSLDGRQHHSLLKCHREFSGQNQSLMGPQVQSGVQRLPNHLFHLQCLHHHLWLPHHILLRLQ